MKEKAEIPPEFATRFLRWFLREKLLEEVEGDLEEQYLINIKHKSSLKSKMIYWYQVLHYLRPFAIKNIMSENSNITVMYRHYFKISLRNIINNKVFAGINIGGLALGMAVTILIGLWVFDELTYDTYHKNYHRIAQVRQFIKFNNRLQMAPTIARPLELVLREEYGNNFQHIAMSSWNREHVLSYNDNQIKQTGSFMQEEVGEMLTIKMKYGSYQGLSDPSSIIISDRISRALFGLDNPIGKIIRLDNLYDVKIIGVYEDLPANTTFHQLTFIAPWSLYITTEEWIKDAENDWWNDSFLLYIQTANHSDMDNINATIKDIYKNYSDEKDLVNRELFLHPMSDWHLRSNWDNGRHAGGRITYVWLFLIIGAFVLILACINFINLSTARSERRLKEVGIRKAIGSVRKQLISQFFSESLMIVFISFIISILLVILCLPQFNLLSEKHILFPWSSLELWISALAFVFFTAILAGGYPSLHLSSFEPIRALKGTIQTSKKALLPRQVLVVLQFTVSVTLIIGTLIIFNQVQHTKNRPVGYERNGLIQVRLSTNDLSGKYDLLRYELINSGAVTEVSSSESEVTGISYFTTGIDWEGKPDDLRDVFAIFNISHEFGKTVNWQLLDGRDFSRDYQTDTAGVILNEKAVKYMNLESPVGMFITWDNTVTFHIIGVIKDMVMQSPYQPVSPSLYMITNSDNHGVYNMKLSPDKSPHESLASVEKIFKQLVPSAPFTYQFVDDTFARKFENEERIGKLSGIFTVLAIFISCLGLFGLASFTAAKRTKEIGIRKVLGATTLNIWKILSFDFLILIVISSLIASPLAYYFMDDWLQHYEYRINMSWWIFLFASTGALILTIITVSFQAIRAAMLNPVKSLRSE